MVRGPDALCTRTLTVRSKSSPPHGGVAWTRHPKKDAIKSVKKSTPLCFSTGFTYQDATTIMAPVAAGKFDRKRAASCSRVVDDMSTWTEIERQRHRIARVRHGD